MKREDIKAGKKYSFGQDYNVFEVLAVHSYYHCVKWDNGEVESIYFEKADLRQIKVAT